MQVRTEWGPHKDQNIRWAYNDDWPEINLPVGVDQAPDREQGVMYMYRVYRLGDKIDAPVTHDGDYRHRYLYCALEKYQQHVWVCSQEDTFAVRMPFTKDFLKVFLGAVRVKAINLN